MANLMQKIPEKSNDVKYVDSVGQTVCWTDVLTELITENPPSIQKGGSKRNQWECSKLLFGPFSPVCSWGGRG